MLYVFDNILLVNNKGEKTLLKKISNEKNVI
jgi:hypothetical protein